MAQRTGLSDNSNMSEDKKRELHSKGGKASRTGSASHHTSGAAGSTEAAKRGGQNS